MLLLRLTLKDLGVNIKRPGTPNREWFICTPIKPNHRKSILIQKHKGNGKHVFGCFLK